MIIKALLLGLSTGVFYMGFCAPVLLGLLFSNKKDGRSGSLKSLSVYLAGRLLAYLLFGLISFLVGEMVLGSKIFILIYPVIEFLLGTLMLAYAANLKFPHWSLCKQTLKWSDSRWTVFIAGIFTGLNLCPPFILALGTAMDSGTIVKSVLFFFIFFIATSIYLIPFVLSGFMSRFKIIRSAAQVVCGLTGLWFLFSGVKNFFLPV